MGWSCHEIDSDMTNAGKVHCNCSQKFPKKSLQDPQVRRGEFTAAHPIFPVDWAPAGFRLIIWFGPPTECGWQVQYHFDVVRSAQTRGPPAEIRSEWGRGFAAIEPTNVHDNKFCEEDSQLMTSWMSVSSEITQMPSLALRAHHCSYCIWSHEKNMQKRRKFFD